MNDKPTPSPTVALIGKVQIAVAIIIVVAAIMLSDYSQNEFSSAARTGASWFLVFAIFESLFMIVSGYFEVTKPYEGLWGMSMLSSVLFVIADICIFASSMAGFTVLFIFGIFLGLFGLGIGLAKSLRY